MKRELCPEDLASLMARKERCDKGGRHVSPKHGDKSVCQYDLAGRLEYVYDSLADAAANNTVKATYSGILACCQRKIRKHHNKIWLWGDKEDSSSTVTKTI